MEEAGEPEATQERSWSRRSPHGYLVCPLARPHEDAEVAPQGKAGIFHKDCQIRVFWELGGCGGEGGRDAGRGPGRRGRGGGGGTLRLAVLLGLAGGAGVNSGQVGGVSKAGVVRSTQFPRKVGKCSPLPRTPPHPPLPLCWEFGFAFPQSLETAPGCPALELCYPEPTAPQPCQPQEYQPPLTELLL